jgi:FKBP-type peptidyl-prolyl cis-trans isomerase FkpA
MRSTFLLLVACAVIALSCEDRSLAISAETQLAIDIDKIDTYLAENGITAQTHPSGLRYVVHQQGSGDRPGPDKCARVNYTVWFLGESDPLESGTNFAFAMANTGIRLGWRIGLKEIQKGGSITLYLPSYQGYGPTGAKIGDNDIPANQILVFYVELLNLTNYNSAAGYCYPWP